MATKPVIAGTDGSQESMQAVEWAAREAVLRGTSLRIVAVPVLPPRMSPNPATRDTVAGMVEHSMTRALAAAAQRAATLEPDLAIQTQMLDGAPAEVLTEAGRDASMLVLGSRGAGGFSAMILGSVSRYVATHAPVPVVVAREETMAAHREIVVGVRDPAQSGAVLGFAFEEAALRKARLLAVHAWSWSAPGHTDVPEEEAATWRARSPPGGRSSPRWRRARKWCTPTRAGSCPACPPGPTWSCWAGMPRVSRRTLRASARSPTPC